MHENFLHACKAIVGEAYVISPENAGALYTNSTLSKTTHTIAGVLKPKNTEEISALVQTAGKYKMPLYPISLGNNWGYGSRTSQKENCVILDLSRMDTILDFEPLSGVITLEPGVSTADVQNFLKERKLSFMTPVMGAGPHASLIGNMLEKGISSSPFQDRLSSLLAMEAILPDGSHYSSYVDDKHSSAPYYRWGVGPYIDGLFAQNNIGIVTKASFYLAPKPSHTEVFFIPLHSADKLDNCIRLLHALALKMPGIITSFQFEGPVRSYAHFTLRNKINFSAEDVLSNDALRIRLQSLGLGFWNCFFVVQGERSVVKAAVRLIKKELRISGYKYKEYSEYSFRIVRMLINALPSLEREKFSHLRLINTYFHRSMGAVKEKNPWMPIWRTVSQETPYSTIQEREQANFDTQEDIGFMLFVAALPIHASFEEIVRDVEQTARQKGIEPLVGIVVVPGHIIHFALQLTYNKQSDIEINAAQETYKMVFHLLRKHGGLPYRVPNPMHHLLKEVRRDFWPLASKIKKAIDPQNIISPGRYIPDVE